MKLNISQLKNFNSSYYAELLNDRKKDFNKIEPITKEVFSNKNPHDFKNQSSTGSTRYVESSGTSGQRSFSWYNEEDLNLISAHIVDRGVRLTSDDVVLIRFSYALGLAASMIDAACKSAGSTIIPASGRGESTPYFKVVDFLCELNVSVLACNPREAELLYEAFTIQGLIPAKDFPSLRAILVAGEVLSPARKKYLESAWGVSVFNIYGATELGNIAYTCEYGHLHFDETHYVAEFRGENGSFAPMPYNQAKAVYITTLSNQTAPHFRFETADVIKFLTDTCECGSEDKLMIGYGRQRDFCFVGGKEYSFYDIQEIIYSLSLIPFGWKLIIDDIPMLQLEFNKRDHINSEKIKEEIYNLFSCDSMELDIAIFDEFGLFDRSDIFKYFVGKKPQYIFNQSKSSLEQFIEEGETLLNTKNFTDAKKVFEKVIKMNKYSPVGNYMMGVLLMKNSTDIGENKNKAYNHFMISKYLGYHSEELDLYINSLSNILFKKS